MAVKTRIIKRNGKEVDFDVEKITNAISKANKEMDRLHQLSEYQIEAIADTIAQEVDKSTHAVHVEDIQDMVETGIMEMRGYEVAQKYVRYRYKRELTRKSNTTDNGILALLEHINEEVKTFPDAFCFRRRSYRHMKPGSFIFMIRIILHRKNTIVI